MINILQGMPSCMSYRKQSLDFLYSLKNKGKGKQRKSIISVPLVRMKMEYICHWENPGLIPKGLPLNSFGLAKAFEQAILGQIKRGAAGSAHSAET